MDKQDKRIWEERLTSILSSNYEFRSNRLASMKSDLKMVYGNKLDNSYANELYQRIEKYYWKGGENQC